MSDKKNLLLIYNGYPALSESYQYDEATELQKHYNLKIYSWKWNIRVVENDVPPYIRIGDKHPQMFIDDMKSFKPDVLHGHYLENIRLYTDLARSLNIKFTIRTHSFDMLTTNINQYRDCVNSPLCNGIFVFYPFKQKCIDAGFDESKVFQYWPSINIRAFRDVFSLPNGNDIMSGGSVLPKKNIEGFILLAKKIKAIYPSKNIVYYSVEEELDYVAKIKNFNTMNGSPVEFKTVQHKDMPLEYKKYQWIIYTACNKLKSVGCPVMIAEAQATGVGVIMYKLRDDLQDYVTDSGYLFTEDDEVLDIISNDFDSDKKLEAYELSTRYDIVTNVEQLSTMFNL